MKRKLNLCLIVALSLILALTGCGSNQTDPQESDNQVATVELANLLEYGGQVMVTSADSEIAAYDGMRFMAGDSVVTGKDSYANIDLDQDRVLIMDENTELKMIQTDDGLLEINLVDGTILNDIAPGGGKYTVRAADTTMAVLGTLFTVNVSPKNPVSVQLLEGQISIGLNRGSESKEFAMSSGSKFVASEENIKLAFDKESLPAIELSLGDLSPMVLKSSKEALNERVGKADDSDTRERIMKELEAAIDSVIQPSEVPKVPEPHVINPEPSEPPEPQNPKKPEVKPVTKPEPEPAPEPTATDVSPTDVSDTNITGTNITDTNITDTNISDTNITPTDVSGTNLKKPGPGASFEEWYNWYRQFTPYFEFHWPDPTPVILPEDREWSEDDRIPESDVIPEGESPSEA